MKHVSYLFAGAFSICLLYAIVHLMSKFPEVIMGIWLFLGAYLLGWLLLGERKP